MALSVRMFQVFSRGGQDRLKLCPGHGWPHLDHHCRTDPRIVGVVLRVVGPVLVVGVQFLRRHLQQRVIAGLCLLRVKDADLVLNQPGLANFLACDGDGIERTPCAVHGVVEPLRGGTDAQHHRSSRELSVRGACDQPGCDGLVAALLGRGSPVRFVDDQQEVRASGGHRVSDGLPQAELLALALLVALGTLSQLLDVDEIEPVRVEGWLVEVLVHRHELARKYCVSRGSDLPASLLVQTGVIGNPQDGEIGVGFCVSVPEPHAFEDGGCDHRLAGAGRCGQRHRRELLVLVPSLCGLTQGDNTTFDGIDLVSGQLQVHVKPTPSSK